MVLCWKNFSLSKFWGVSVLWKKSIFSIFSLPHLKKIQTILIRPILNFDALPIAHFETYVPLFLKHLWKLAISLKLWVPAHFEVGWSRTVAAQIAVFRPFFGRKWSLTAKPSTFDPIVLYIIGKLCIWRVWNSGGKSIFDHRWSARIFVTHTDWIATLIRFLVLNWNWLKMPFLHLLCEFLLNMDLPDLYSFICILWIQNRIRDAHELLLFTVVAYCSIQCH